MVARQSQYHFNMAKSFGFWQVSYPGSADQAPTRFQDFQNGERVGEAQARAFAATIPGAEVVGVLRVDARIGRKWGWK